MIDRRHLEDVTNQQQQNHQLSPHQQQQTSSSRLSNNEPKENNNKALVIGNELLNLDPVSAVTCTIIEFKVIYNIIFQGFGRRNGKEKRKNYASIIATATAARRSQGT